MGRLPFIDWTRGFAVVAMILWHTGDAWLSADQRTGQSWLALRFVGGLAAPSFTFLAGVGAALATRPRDSVEHANRALRASAGRALEVLLIGYLLRYQSWVLDASAITKLGTLRAWLPLGLGYGALVWGANRLADRPREAAWWMLSGVAACALGLVQVDSVAPGRFVKLMQVDVLQAIGMSLLLLAIGERSVGLLRRPPWLVLLAAAVAVSTEAITAALPGPIPVPLAGYLGKFATPTGAPPPALFPLFPWLAYPLLGAAVGCCLKRASLNPERITVRLAILGACVALCTSEAQPYVHRAIALWPWLVNPVRIGFRTGLVLVLLMIGWLWAVRGRGRMLIALGQSSLRVYWAHMLFAYGMLGRPLQKKSDFALWAVCCIPLVAAMWLLTRVGNPAPRAPQTAPQHSA